MLSAAMDQATIATARDQAGSRINCEVKRMTIQAVSKLTVTVIS